jgi:hypothetical protein
LSIDKDPVSDAALYNSDYPLDLTEIDNFSCFDRHWGFFGGSVKRENASANVSFCSTNSL